MSGHDHGYLNCAAAVKNFKKNTPALLVLLLATVIIGCGAEKKSEGEGGDAVTVDGAVYEVQYSRLLNAGDPEDKAYLVGQPKLKAGEIYLGVFVKIRNDGDKPYTPPKEIELTEAGGDRFHPIDASKSPFALDFNKAIPPGGVEPAADAVAATGPADGSLILYKINQSSIQRQPLMLEIPARDGRDGEIHIDV